MLKKRNIVRVRWLGTSGSCLAAVSAHYSIRQMQFSISVLY